MPSTLNPLNYCDQLPGRKQIFGQTRSQECSWRLRRQTDRHLCGRRKSSGPFRKWSFYNSLRNARCIHSHWLVGETIIFIFPSALEPHFCMLLRFLYGLAFDNARYHPTLGIAHLLSSQTCLIRPTLTADCFHPLIPSAYRSACFV